MRLLERLHLVAVLLAFASMLIYLPLRGDYSFGTGVLIVGALVLLGVLNQWPQVFRGGEFFLALLAAVGAFIAAPRHISGLAFYEATAQIVPILFLALAIEARAFAPERHRDEPERRLALLIAAALIFAGYESLMALASNDARAADFETVAAALAGATTALALPAIIGTGRGAAAKSV